MTGRELIKLITKHGFEDFEIDVEVEVYRRHVENMQYSSKTLCVDLKGISNLFFHDKKLRLEGEIDE